jgi:hypothetical protein
VYPVRHARFPIVFIVEQQAIGVDEKPDIGIPLRYSAGKISGMAAGKQFARTLHFNKFDAFAEGQKKAVYHVIQRIGGIGSVFDVVSAAENTAQVALKIVGKDNAVFFADDLSFHRDKGNRGICFRRAPPVINGNSDIGWGHFLCLNRVKILTGRIFLNTKSK